MKRLIPILLLLVSGVAHADKLQLNCLVDDAPPDFVSVYIVDTDKLKVHWVGDLRLTHGVVEISDDYYFFRFPKTENRWETWMKINRYTGQFYREWGEPPFFRDFATEGNIVHMGKCEVSDAEQLF